MSRPDTKRRATLRLGTRGSRLARVQAEIVARALRHSGLNEPIEFVEIRTHGDAISAAQPRGGYEGTDGQFTAELERAVVAGDVDLAVHSLKDLPTAATAETVVAALLPRADARDCLIDSARGGLRGLPEGAIVGTSSVRREAQLRAIRPDVRVRPIRGNVETRIARVERGEYDAVILACAGLDRLGITVPEEARLAFDVMLPAPAQGALAVQARADRPDLLRRLAAIDDRETRIAVEAERALLVAIGGGCLAPLGALGQVADRTLRLRAVYAPTSGTLVSVDASGSWAASRAVVQEAARGLLGEAVSAP
jgi:hydroxymethylbilane synthase